KSGSARTRSRGPSVTTVPVMTAVAVDGGVSCACATGAAASATTKSSVSPAMSAVNKRILRIVHLAGNTGHGDRRIIYASLWNRNRQRDRTLLSPFGGDTRW